MAENGRTWVAGRFGAREAAVALSALYEEALDVPAAELHMLPGVMSDDSSMGVVPITPVSARPAVASISWSRCSPWSRRCRWSS